MKSGLVQNSFKILQTPEVRDWIITQQSLFFPAQLFVSICNI